MSKRSATSPLNQTRMIKKPAFNRQPSLVNPPFKKRSDEKKNFDLAIPYVIPAGGAFATNLIVLNTVPIGNLAQERVGRKIIMTSIHLRFSGLPAVSSPLRIYIIYDKQANQLGATSATALSGAAPNFQSFQELENSERFVILVDRIMDFNSGPYGSSIYRKMNLDAVFTDVTGTIPVTGSVLLGFSNSSSASTTINFASRIRYVDN